jgi:hypothetical protein
MPIPDFQSFSIWVNVAIFAPAAVAVWIGGTRLADYAAVRAGNPPKAVSDILGRDRIRLRMGYDSVAVLVAYSAGLVGLCFLR